MTAQMSFPAGDVRNYFPSPQKKRRIIVIKKKKKAVAKKKPKKAVKKPISKYRKDEPGLVWSTFTIDGRTVSMSYRPTGKKEDKSEEPAWKNHVLYVVNETKRVYFMAKNEKEAKYFIGQFKAKKKWCGKKDNIFLSPSSDFIYHCDKDERYYKYWDAKKLAQICPPKKKKAKK